MKNKIKAHEKVLTIEQFLRLYYNPNDCQQINDLILRAKLVHEDVSYFVDFLNSEELIIDLDIKCFDKIEKSKLFKMPRRVYAKEVKTCDVITGRIIPVIDNSRVKTYYLNPFNDMFFNYNK